MRPASRILIADDHPLFREALRNVVGRVCPAVGFVEVASFADMVAATAVDEAFDLIFLDVVMPGGDVLSELRRLRERNPLTPVIVVSAHEDRATIRAVAESGAAGYICKSQTRAAMEIAIAGVMAGESCFPDEAAHGPSHAAAADHLTPRQIAVLEQLGNGCSNRQIASRLGIEEITVKVHISAILRKLGVKNRLEAVVASGRRSDNDATDTMARSR